MEGIHQCKKHDKCISQSGELDNNCNLLWAEERGICEPVTDQEEPNRYVVNVWVHQSVPPEDNRTVTRYPSLPKLSPKPVC